MFANDDNEAPVIPCRCTEVWIYIVGRRAPLKDAEVINGDVKERRVGTGWVTSVWCLAAVTIVTQRKFAAALQKGRGAMREEREKKKPSVWALVLLIRISGLCGSAIPVGQCP